MAAGVFLVVAGDAALVALALSERGSDAVVVALAASAVVAGLLIARWWVVALALPLFLAITVMYDRMGDQELTFLGWVIVVAGLIAGIQAAALALGAGSRWAYTHRDEVKQILRR